MSIISSEADSIYIYESLVQSNHPDTLPPLYHDEDLRKAYVQGASRQPTEAEIKAALNEVREFIVLPGGFLENIIRTALSAARRKATEEMSNLIHCDMCGYLMTKRWSETIDGKTYCRDCVPKKRLIDSGEPTEFDDTDEIVCPYCGHRYEDSYECGANDEYFEEECENCGREFNVTRIIDISYDTKPKEATEE